MKLSRRSFFTAAGLSAAAFGSGSLAMSPTLAREVSGSGKILFDLGIATYSFRKFTPEKVIEWTKQAGLKYVSLKDFHLPLTASDSDCADLAKKFENEGLKIYSCGVVYMKNEEEVENAFRYAKALGCSSIIGVPDHKYLSLVEKKVKETDIRIAIHNHGPGDKRYPTAASVWEKVKSMDPRIGIALDIGHSVRIGEDPIQAIHQYKDRIFDFHFKDITSADKAGRCAAMCGTGVIDFPSILKALVEIGYDRIAPIEYETLPDDPFPGVMQYVGYIRGMCKMI